MWLRNSLLCVAVAVFALSILPGRALAEESAPGLAPSVPAPQDNVVTERYGLEILAIDATAIALGIAAESPVLFLGGYSLGGPIVHLIHDNSRGALVSLILRTGVPLALATMGGATSAHDCGSDEDEAPFCGLAEAAVGWIVGMAIATAVDAGVVARKQTRVVNEPTALLRYRGILANPDVVVTRSGSFTIGLSGRF